MKWLLLFLGITTSLLSCDISTVYGRTQTKRVQRLVARIHKATFSSDKKSVARKLGRLRTPEAKKALLKLLVDRDSWTKGAAVAGLFQLRDPSLTKELYKTMKKDSWLRNDIRKGFQQQTHVYFDGLEKIFHSLTSSYNKRDLLEILGKVRTKRSKNLLKSVLQGKNTLLKKSALSLFSKYHWKGEHDFVTSFLKQPSLREDVLLFLLQRGTKKDYPVFLKLLQAKKKKAKEFASALLATKKWGNKTEQEKYFLQGLKHTDSSFVSATLRVLGKKVTRRKHIQERLCWLAQFGRAKYIRIRAVEHLLHVPGKRVVPALILGLKETYIPYVGRQTRGSDIFIGFVTLGLVPLLNSYSHRQASSGHRSSYSSRMRRIARSLRRRTRKRFGTSFPKWFHWAVLQGYEVGGQHLVQWLFSKNPTVRQKAQQATIRYLGYQSKYRFHRKYPELKGEKSLKLSIKLAAMMVKKGFFNNAP